MASKSRDDAGGLVMMVRVVEESFVRPGDEKSHVSAITTAVQCLSWTAYGVQLSCVALAVSTVSPCDVLAFFVTP